MRRRIPVWVGFLAAIGPVVWISVITMEQIPEPVKIMVHEPAVQIGLLLFQSREAALAIEFPLFVIYSCLFGLVIGLLCRLILRRINHEGG